MKPILPFAALMTFQLFSANTAFAQQNQTQSQTPVQGQPSLQIKDSIMPTPKKTVATVISGLVFAPRLHYYGRTDDLKSNALLPTVNLEFDSVHIYASATGVLLSNKIQTMDYAGTIAEVGYKFGKYGKGFNGNVYGNKFFYTTTQLPQSSLEEQAGTNITYMTKPINFTLTGNAAFSKERTDFFSSIGLNKIFKWKFKKSILLVTPTYVMNAGSQNFTNVNYKTNLTPGIPIIDQEEVYQQNRQFKILDHEISVPVILATKHFYFIATPTYIRPENVIEIPNHPELSETAKNLFFINLTVLYSFKFTK